MRRLFFHSLYGISVWYIGVLFPCRAEVTLDGSLGTAGTIAGPNYTIPASAGRQVGGNLFHSFARFGIATNQSATFTDTGALGPVHNILSRVTGGQPSVIDGKLGTSFAHDTPNLFFINPAGVIFGPNATLNVQGSFHVSTADYLQFRDGVRFAAQTSASDGLLTTAPVDAFGFLQGKLPAKITFSGSQLQVPDSKKFSVIAGDIVIENSQLHAASGQINLTSLETASSVPLSNTTSSQIPFAHSGNITIRSSDIVASGDPTGGGRGGQIVIRSGRLSMDNSGISANNHSDLNGQGISIELTDALTMRQSGIFSTALSGLGTAGDIALKARFFRLTEGSQIASGTFGKGNGGRIEIEGEDFAAEGVDFIDANGSTQPVNSGLFSNAEGEGNSHTKGGSIAIKVENLQLKKGAQINASSFGESNGGDIVIKSKNIVAQGQENFVFDSQNATIFSGIFASANSSGGAGNITIETGNLSLNDGASVSSTVENGAGNGGKIMVTAKTISSTGVFSGIFSSTLDQGNAGNIKIDSDRIELHGGAQVNASTASSGQGGKITIRANSIIAEGGTDLVFGSRTIHASSGIISNAQGEQPGSGNAGEISITADSLKLKDTAQITTSTRGFGNAGVLSVNAKEIVLDGQVGRIRTGFLSNAQGRLPGSGNANSLFVNTERLELKNGAGISSSTLGPGNGSNLNINAKNIILSNNATINSNTSGSGQGGSIMLNADTIDMDNASLIQARSESATADAGKSGNILIKSTSALRLERISRVTVETAVTDAGDINIQAGKILRLNGGSSVTTSAAVANPAGRGNGGNINIQSGFAILQNASTILAQAKQGSGGKIDIGSDYLFRSPDSIINASSEGGRQGTIIIKSPDSNITNSILKLPAAILITKIEDRCASQASDIGKSSFKQGHRQELYTIPGITHLPLFSQTSYQIVRQRQLSKRSQHINTPQQTKGTSYSPGSYDWTCNL